jgi:hypothetical protein
VSSATPDSVRVAAVWTRDARQWEMALRVTSAQVRALDKDQQKLPRVPIDVAAYTVGTEVRFAALWAEPLSADDVGGLFCPSRPLSRCSTRTRKPA